MYMFFQKVTSSNLVNNFDKVRVYANENNFLFIQLSRRMKEERKTPTRKNIQKGNFAVSCQYKY